jgi:ribosomal protein S21
VVIRVEPGENENVLAALLRLKMHAKLAQRRAWVKRRLGYYEKPSILRRKRRKMNRRNRYAEGHGIVIWLDLGKQLRRSGPFAIGR